MALAQSDVAALAARYGNEIITAQVDEDCPILRSGALERIPMRGREAIVNVVGGGLNSTQFITDGASLQTGGQSTPSQGTVTPCHILARLAIGRGAAKLGAGVEDSVDQVRFQLENAGRDVARKFGRALFNAELNADGYLSGSSVPSAGVYQNVFVSDLSGFRVGDSVTLFDTSASQTFALTVTAATPAAVNSNSINVGGQLTLANTVPGFSTATSHGNGNLPTLQAGSSNAGDQFWLMGKYNITGATSTAADQSAVPVSFADIAGSATLHGLAGTTNDWSGNTRSGFGVLTQESLMQVGMAIKARSGKFPSHVILHPAAAGAYAASGLSNGSTYGLTTAGARHEVGTSLSKYDGAKIDEWETGLRFLGRPVIADPNCPATSIVLHNDQMVRLGVWQDFQPETEGDGAALVDRSSYIYDVQLVGMMNMVCNQRSSIGFISGIANL